MSVEAALLELGLLDHIFYDSLWGSEPGDIEALEAVAGVVLPERYREFLQLCGASLGNLQIHDGVAKWRFEPEVVTATLEAKAADERKRLRDVKHVPVALIGKSLSLGYEHVQDICLYLEAESGWLSTDDYDRGEHVYDCWQAFLLEWGHRQLDANMGERIRRARLVGLIERLTPKDATEAMRTWVAQATLIPPTLMASLHAVAAGDSSLVQSYVGGLLGVYRYFDSGIIVKGVPLNYPDATMVQVEVEARHPRGTAPQGCTAARVMGELEARLTSVGAIAQS